MNRRNVLIGLGAIAVGGGAAVSTGAFSSVEADRTVSVTTAGDASALLGLSTLNTSIANINQGTISLDFGSIGGSTGINYNAVTEWIDVFRITNNGEDDVTVHLTQGPSAPAALLIETGDGVFFYDSDGSASESAGDPVFEFYLRATGTDSVPTRGNADAFAGSGNAVSLSVGASKDVQVRFDTTGVTSADVGATTELMGELTIVANAV